MVLFATIIEKPAYYDYWILNKTYEPSKTDPMKEVLYAVFSFI